MRIFESQIIFVLVYAQFMFKGYILLMDKIVDSLFKCHKCQKSQQQNACDRALLRKPSRASTHSSPQHETNQY